MLEWGFMSTTADKAVAIHYCGIREGKPFPTIFEIDSGAVDRGADITDLSQYPGKHLVFTLSIRILTFGGSESRTAAMRVPRAAGRRGVGGDASWHSW